MNEIYTAVPAETVREDWKGRGEVMVPAPWLRELAGLPARWEHATLHESVAHEYPPHILAAARRYVARWPEIRGAGTWMNLLGDPGSGKTHTAAAMVHEILGHFGQVGGIRTFWLAASWGLQDLLDYRHFGQQEEYRSLRKRIFNADLLVVDDLGHAAAAPSVRELLFGLYDYRYQKKLPTITTANVRITADDWSALHTLFNEPFSRRLREAGKGFTVVV